MSLDEFIINEVKKWILWIGSAFKAGVIDTILEGLFYNPFIYILSFYIGFILTWYFVGFLFGKLKNRFNLLVFILDLGLTLYFGVLFILSGFIAGIFVSLVVMDLVKFILPRLGYNPSDLITRKMIVYFWIIPLVIKIIKDKIEFRKYQKEKEDLIIKQNEEKIKNLIESQEKMKLEAEEKFRQIEEVDKVLSDKIDNVLKKLDKF